MKVKIRTDKCKLTLIFPTSILMGRFSFSIAMRHASGYVELDDEQKTKIIKLLKKTRKQYKGLKIVDLKTAGGEIVEITL